MSDTAAPMTRRERCTIEILVGRRNANGVVICGAVLIARDHGAERRDLEASELPDEARRAIP
jgi:hypothetical protein